MLEVLLQISDAKDAGAVVLTGAGRAFCTGGDTKEAKTFTTEQYRESLQLQRRLCSMVYLFDKPVIAAINGYALAGGLELAMVCDIRIAAESARIGVPVIQAASVSTAGLYLQLARSIGVGRTAHLVLGGEPITAGEAERIGLLNKVVPDDLLFESAEVLAQKLISYPPLALTLARRGLRHAEHEIFELMAELDEGLALAAWGGRLLE